MPTYLLIHGSWHTAEHWNDVIAHLADLGQTAVALTVLGHGKGVEKRVSHDEQIADLVSQIKARDLSDLILVGHSYGGTVIARLAEEVPDRIRRLVFWNAFVNLPGNSIIEEVPPHYRDLFAHLASVTDDGSVMLPWPIWRDAFMNDADIDLATATYDTLSSEPYQPFLDKLPLDRFYATKIPKSYLNCTEDTALPPGEWGWHPRMSSRLGPHRLVQMAGGHEVMFTNPKGLAARIVEAGRD